MALRCQKHEGLHHMVHQMLVHNRLRTGSGSSASCSQQVIDRVMFKYFLVRALSQQMQFLCKISTIYLFLERNALLAKRLAVLASSYATVLGIKITHQPVRTSWGACSKQAGLRGMQIALQHSKLYNDTTVMYKVEEIRVLLYPPRTSTLSFIPQKLQSEKPPTMSKTWLTDIILYINILQSSMHIKSAFSGLYRPRKVEEARWRLPCVWQRNLKIDLHHF